MKKIIQTVTAFIVALAMVSAPVVEAQTRGRQAHGTTSGQGAASHRAPSASRPGNSQGHSGGQRPGNNGNSRPSNPGNRPSASGNNRPSVPGGSQEQHRPGNNHNQGNHRPSTPGTSRPSSPGNNNHNYRPGNNNHPTRPGNDWNRPATGMNPGHRPGHGDYRPGAGAHRPGHGGFRPGRPTPPPPPPPRHPANFHHHVPFFGHYRRPLPPPRWHYHNRGPVFGTILGVALGTAIGVSINALINNGYTVSSYGNDVVYLSNVPQMNYTWPDAALYYTNGVLTGSQFTYPSPYYDMTRYNSLYNTFTAQYGMPIQTVNQGGIMSATWFGPANRFVTLSFNTQYGGSFYTTLSFGN